MATKKTAKKSATKKAAPVKAKAKAQVKVKSKAPAPEKPAYRPRVNPGPSILSPVGEEAKKLRLAREAREAAAADEAAIDAQVAVERLDSCPILHLVKGEIGIDFLDPFADDPAHWRNTALADIPEFAETVARYDMLRAHIKELEAIKDELGGNLKTWGELVGIEVGQVVIGAGFDIVRTESTRTSLDREKLVVAGVTEAQLVAGTKTSKSVSIRVVEHKQDHEAEAAK